ncbi:uncharacterized protein B0I36DRAFT_250525 [Microdochium trichocladiopsis]|uniref:Ecp2 effector protein domain-containing protein n=1 Tax=Microdochium trichocladiopsis TaxID=1682393 RepID=A0A9P8XX00_9PEZI|nr:uncharacterized protein B0I36DRAFT_250525 [Microdochium trichocladiopsis]KAH7024378.1 hypothetical protein B0I36DRAFT_250525 [Microdochium trichocladiopsis]
MLPQSLLAVVFAATTAVAFPAPDGQEPAQVVRFKRDSILEARDFELAEAHGVDLSKMYKHSLLKRGDGDHVTVWVDRRYVEHEDLHEARDTEAALEERDINLRVGKDAAFSGSIISDYCYDHKRQDHTGPNGPTTGGVKAIYQWARAHGGGKFNVKSTTNWENLVVAGSNGGTNALYRARALSGGTDIGTQDVRNDADWTLSKQRSFSGSWRASSKGGESCYLGRRINYELIRTQYNV